ncbi:MAG: DNA polymerase, beta-like protein region [Candidatus Peregrinibacteria bacterium Greene0416_19]|nr:MAG: DNA polymerase, beta-like protein region [Candidatus Peregrinibacteria bacterium Greene0416_19]
MKKTAGVLLARSLKERLLRRGYPIRQVYLFGSVAQGTAREDSDVDIAVICDPFLPSKHDENVQFLLMGNHVNLRIETVCLHPADFQNKYFTLAREIERTGVEV